MNAAEAIVRMLVETGVRHIFGLPGDTSMDFYDALYRHRDVLTHVLTRDERSAAFMADAYARVSGRLGVVESPSGGGATYVLPGIAEAHGSSYPLLSLTTDVPIAEEGRGVLTELDQESLFRPVTKWATRIKTSSSAPEVLRRALRMATSGRPGAVSVVMPADVLRGPVDEETVYGLPEALEVPSQRTRPDPEAITRAADLIAQARRPVIVAGGGVRISGAWDELTALAEACNIPVGTSINGKGSVPETSPISLGVVGGNGARPYANEILAEADAEADRAVAAGQAEYDSLTSRARDEHDRMLQAGREAYERSVQQGMEEQARLVSETEVVQAAHAEAARLVDEAHAEAERQRSECDAYIDGKLAEFADLLDRTLRSVDQGRSQLRGGSFASSFGHNGYHSEHSGYR